MSSALSPRVPTLEWSHRAAAGELEALSWVDTRLDPRLAPMRQVAKPGKPTRFRARQHLEHLPTPLVEAATDAQSKGRTTAWEGLQLLFAGLEWLVEGRRYLWAPFSPVPRLLATLVETYGVEPAIHRNDPERLSRLAALLPVWHPFRGSVRRARELLDTCDLADQLDGAVGADGESGEGEAPDLRDEVFACHGLHWWDHRSETSSETEYRISGGYLRFQPENGVGFAIRREDVLIHWQPGRPVPHDAIRLLPAWTSVRLAAPTGRN